jgi:hypothetical protein
VVSRGATLLPTRDPLGHVQPNIVTYFQSFLYRPDDDPVGVETV